jgi:hypothetical protein
MSSEKRETPFPHIDDMKGILNLGRVTGYPGSDKEDIKTNERTG